MTADDLKSMTDLLDVVRNKKLQVRFSRGRRASAMRLTHLCDGMPWLPLRESTPHCPIADVASCRG